MNHPKTKGIVTFYSQDNKNYYGFLAGRPVYVFANARFSCPNVRYPIYAYTSNGGPSLPADLVDLQSQPIFRLPDTWPSPVLFLDPAFWPCPITSLSSVLGIEKEPRWVAPYITACVCYIKNCIKVINPNTTDKTNPTLVIASCFLLFFSFSILLSFSVFNSTAIRLTTFFPSSTF